MDPGLPAKILAEHELYHLLLWCFTSGAAQGSWQVRESVTGAVNGLGREPGLRPPLLLACTQHGLVLALGALVSQKQLGICENSASSVAVLALNCMLCVWPTYTYTGLMFRKQGHV